jgi:hypothetical protein
VQSAKKWNFQELFLRGKSRGLGPWAVDHVRPRSMVDRPWTTAPSSPELGLQPLWCPRAPAKGGRGGVGRGELSGPLTGARRQ